MKKTTRISMATAALLSLTSLSLAVALTAQAVQTFNDKSFGLAQGSRWTYRETQKDGSTGIVTKEATAKHNLKGRVVTELKVKARHYDHYEYVGADESGLYRYMNAYLGGHPGLAEDYEPTPLLKRRLKKGDSWKWTEIVPVQTMGNYKYDAEDWRMNTTATVEAVDEEIRTVAGAFTVTVVRYDAVGQRKLGKSMRRAWISADAGVVREETVSDREHRTLELTEFCPGGSVPPPAPTLNGGG